MADIVEFMGLTREGNTLVERLRQASDETKCDILVRVLAGMTRKEKEHESKEVDLGQGVRLRVGETPLLFLSDPKRNKQPDALAEIRPDGFYMDGKKIVPSKKSVLTPAMKTVQKRKNHRNAKGGIISLNAFKKWHVVRDGKLFSMEDLKDPALARRRKRAAPENLTLADLDL